MKRHNGIAILGILLAGCAVRAPENDLRSIRALSAAMPERIVRAQAAAATLEACEARPAKLCGGQYPDCCDGLVCPVAGPNKNHCTPEQQELDRVMAQPMPADEQAPAPPGTAKGAATEPWRPSYLDANVLRKPGSHLAWCQGRTCTQVGRHALQEVVTDVYLPEAILYARTIPGCAGVLHFVEGSIEVVVSRLGTNYMCKSVCTGPSGAWFINLFDRQYTFPFKSLIKIGQCSVTNAAAADCAASPLMTDGLMQLLNLRKENGRCVTGNPTTQAFMAKAKLEAYASSRGADGLVLPKALTPAMALDAEDRRLLHATHAAHKYGTLCKIGRGLDALDEHDRAALAPWVTTFACPPAQVVYAGKPTGLATAIHETYEARCQLPGKGSETCHHARRLMDFSGKVAPTWDTTPDDKAVLLLLEDVAGHGTWMAAQERIGTDPAAWCAIVGEDNNHRNAHVCAALGKRDLKIRPFRPDCQESCPVLTCQQWIDASRDLAKLLAAGAQPM